VNEIKVDFDPGMDVQQFRNSENNEQPRRKRWNQDNINASGRRRASSAPTLKDKSLDVENYLLNKVKDVSQLTN
jgi:hypothetical protein